MHDPAKLFVFKKNQAFYSLLGDKTVLLKRALMQKNICITVYPEPDVRPFFYRWLAKGKSRGIAFRGTMPLATTFKANKVIRDKSATKEVLRASGVKVPDEILFHQSEMKKVSNWYHEVGIKKVVLKPLVGSGGKGVVSGIVSEDELEREILSSSARKLIVEEHVDGDDHRILVVGGKVVAAMRRWPANVTGDGVSTISQLVENKNIERSKNPYDRSYPIKIDRDIIERLGSRQMSVDSIVPEGETIYLREVANIGMGGEGEDVTSIIHPDFIAEAVKCWKAFDDLEVCGVDLIAQDISKPAEDQSYAVIELNANCDIPIHHWPAIGGSLDVASVIADYYFPDDKKDISHSVDVLVKGKVVGVGFRRWLAKQAVIHGVTGFVHNQDGVVIAHLEGSEYSVNSMLSLCGNGPKKAEVESMSFRKSPNMNMDVFEVHEGE